MWDKMDKSTFGFIGLTLMGFPAHLTVSYLSIYPTQTNHPSSKIDEPTIENSYFESAHVL
jgi:hypothetical protein